jgi:hypothetical protein
MDLRDRLTSALIVALFVAFFVSALVTLSQNLVACREYELADDLSGLSPPGVHCID